MPCSAWSAACRRVSPDPNNGVLEAGGAPGSASDFIHSLFSPGTFLRRLLSESRVCAHCSLAEPAPTDSSAPRSVCVTRASVLVLALPLRTGAHAEQRRAGASPCLSPAEVTQSSPCLLSQLCGSAQPSCLQCVGCLVVVILCWPLAM